MENRLQSTEYGISKHDPENSLKLLRGNGAFALTKFFKTLFEPRDKNQHAHY